MSEAVKVKVKRGKRNPERTREAILEVAGKLLAQDGPEGLSVSQVAQLAGLNRGTAYHHFQTREELLKATTAWVSEKLCKEVFGFIPQTGDDPMLMGDPRKISENLIRFAMDNPEFGRVWLFDVLSSSDPSRDPFWKIYKAHIDHFAQSKFAEPGIDTEVHAVKTLVGVFLWPVWARAHSRSAVGRRRLAKRFTDESLRYGLHGSMRSEMFPGLEQKLGQKNPGGNKTGK